MKGLRIAITFLTVLPLRAPDNISADDLRRSTVFFPLVGWLIGTILLLTAKAAEFAGMPPLVAAVLVLVVAAWLTRGLHLDGLADLLDGLGGSHDPVKRLAIMKDSAVGVFGVLGLILLLSLKMGCLARLVAGPAELPWPLLVAPSVAARWAMVFLAYDRKYPRRSGTGHSFVGTVKRGDLVGGAFFLAPLLVAGPPVFFVAAATLVPAWWLRRKAPRFLGGVTGDVLGASCELGEAAGWLAAVVALQVWGLA